MNREIQLHNSRRHLIGYIGILKIILTYNMYLYYYLMTKVRTKFEYGIVRYGYPIRQKYNNMINDNLYNCNRALKI